MILKRILGFVFLDHLAWRIDKPAHHLLVFAVDSLELEFLETFMLMDDSFRLCNFWRASSHASVWEKHRTSKRPVSWRRLLHAAGRWSIETWRAPPEQRRRLFRIIKLLWVLLALRVSQVSTDTWPGCSLILLMIGLVLEEQELIGFVVGTVIGEIRHSWPSFKW